MDDGTAIIYPIRNDLNQRLKKSLDRPFSINVIKNEIESEMPKDAKIL